MANVLSIVPYKIFPANSGGQKAIALFNEYLSKEYNLFCVTVKNNDPSFASYKVFNILADNSFRYINPYYFFLIKKIINQNKITLLIIEHPYFGWMAILLKQFCKVKLIVRSHNIEGQRFKTTGKWWWNILSLYEKYIHSAADFTFCITAEDRNYFHDNYQIPYEKSAVITYGIPWDSLQPVNRAEIKKALLQQYSLPANTKLFLFNGSLNYEPNLNAVKNIIEKINPLFTLNKIEYKIMICGKNLPAEMNNLKEYADKNIIYAGFVDDISIYFKGADAFINPVIYGGGIKTKLVEALGDNLNAVSTLNGAIGVDEEICNGKLLICENDDWQGFSDKMMQAITNNNSIQQEFFNNFYWGKIVIKATKIIEKL